MANAAAVAAVEGAVNDPRVRAFLDGVVRAGESNADDSGYFERWGGTFTDLSHHPGITTCIYIARLGRQFCSDAAGAYQFLGSTWRGIVAALGLPDFSRDSQFRGAIYLIWQNGSLAALQNNDIETAIAKSRATWPSLPGGSQALSSRTMASAVAQYNAALGAAAPLPAVSVGDNAGIPPLVTQPQPFSLDSDTLMVIVAGILLIGVWSWWNE